jgi:hypothetical protein
LQKGGLVFAQQEQTVIEGKQMVYQQEMVMKKRI